MGITLYSSRYFLPPLSAAKSSRPLLHRRSFQIPDLVRILRDGSIAGEFTGASHVDDRVPRPSLGVGIGSGQVPVGAAVVSQVREMPKAIAVGEQCVSDWVEQAGLTPA